MPELLGESGEFLAIIAGGLVLGIAGHIFIYLVATLVASAFRGFVGWHGF